MQSSHHTMRRARQAVLNEGSRVDPSRPHDIGVERTAEETAFVYMRARLEQHRTSDTGNRAYVHWASSQSTVGGLALIPS
jgi:hypothetical protein